MKWIDTSKQLPAKDKEGWSKLVLTYDVFGNTHLCNLVNEDWIIDSGVKKNEFVTYWRELPEEPDNSSYGRHDPSERRTGESAYEDFLRKYGEKSKAEKWWGI